MFHHGASIFFLFSCIGSIFDCQPGQASIYLGKALERPAAFNSSFIERKQEAKRDEKRNVNVLDELKGKNVKIDPVKLAGWAVQRRHNVVSRWHSGEARL